jgi:DNA sulfur modification protein DndE
MIAENVRVSEKAKSQLISIKRKTGIPNWNVICRWAIVKSLVEPTPAPHENITTDSSVEMSWKVFSGEYSDLIEGLIRSRMISEALDVNDKKIVQEYLKIHLHRGISYLSKVKDISELIYMALDYDEKNIKVDA